MRRISREEMNVKIQQFQVADYITLDGEFNISFLVDYASDGKTGGELYHFSLCEDGVKFELEVIPGTPIVFLKRVAPRPRLAEPRVDLFKIGNFTNAESLVRFTTLFNVELEVTNKLKLLSADN